MPAESIAFAYDGADGLTATITDAVPGRTYILTCDGAAVGGDNQTAVGTTLILTNGGSGGTPGQVMSVSVYADVGPPAYYVGWTIFHYGTPAEAAYAAVWSYDGVDTVSVRFIAANGVSYTLEIGDTAGSGSNSLIGDGSEATLTATGAAPQEDDFFSGILYDDGGYPGGLFTVRLFTPGLAGAGFLGNPLLSLEAPNINAFSVAIAFADGPLVETPTWTYLDSIDGIRVQQWDISRGRPNELEKTSTGTATVTIADHQGVFDPTNTSSPYYPATPADVLPDKQAMIQLFDPVQETWHTLFRGYIEDIDYQVRSITYDSGIVVHGVLFVTLHLVDAFAFLTDHELMPGQAGDTPPAGSEGRVFYEDSGVGNSVQQRIQAILADVGWPAGLTSIFTGNVKVTETIYEPGTSALAALFDAADAEFPGVANLYVSKDGILTFHGRQARFRPDVAQYGINRRDVGDPSVTVLDDTVAPIAELEFAYGKTFIYNSALVLPQDTIVGVAPIESEIDAQLVEDTDSIDAHGKKGLTFTDLLTLEGLTTGNLALDETKLFATYYVDNYKDPLPRITRMVFKSRMPEHRLADPLWKMMCRCEISDLLTVTTAHKGGGGFGEGHYVEGIRYTCRPANDRVHNVTLEVDVSPQALYTTNPFDADVDPE